MSLRSLFARTTLLCALAVPATVFIPTDADASVSIAVQFEALVKDADAVVVVTPAETYSVWEDGRIASYTHVKVDQGVAGELGAGADGYVRTMGGVVGKIGQLVDGEPVLSTGKQSLLFMRKFKQGGVYEVSARGQGQYPVTIHAVTKAKMLRASNTAGVILPPKKVDLVDPPGAQSTPPVASPSPELATKVPRLATEVMHERALDDAAKEIATTWARLHAVVPAATK